MAVRSMWAFVVFILAAAITGLPTNEKSYREVLHAMDFHEDGVTHLGDDGVLRSFHPNGTVIEYQKLSPNQIGQMLDGFGRNEHLEEVYNGVNGHSVSHYQALNPGEDLLPRRFKNSTDYTIDLGKTKAECNHLGGCNPTIGAFVQTKQKAQTSNNTQALQERGHGHGVHHPVVINTQSGRYCEDIVCTRHYHCYGTHPACLRCFFPDNLDEGSVRAVCG